MPIPKALVAKREEEDLPTDDLGGGNGVMSRSISSSPSISSPSTSTRQASSESKSAAKVLVKKKRTSVKWSSDVSSKAGISGDIYLCESERKSNHPSSGRGREATRSPSPSTSLTLLELEHDVKKQEESIRRACELELKLLNQCTRVREKRSRMVQRLRKLKRSMKKLASVDKWTIAQFSFPPEYEPSSSKAGPHMIDMTKSDEFSGEDLVINNSP